MSGNDKRFAYLLSRVCDGELNAEETKEFEGLLEGSVEFRDAYVEMMHLRFSVCRWIALSGQAEQSPDVERLLGIQVSEDLSSGLACETRTSGSRRSVGDVPVRRGAAHWSEFSNLRDWAKSHRSWGYAIAGSILAVCLVTFLFMTGLGDGEQGEVDQLVAESGKVLGYGDTELLVDELPKSHEQLGDPRLLDKEVYSLSDSESVVARIVYASSDVSWMNETDPSDFLYRLRPGELLKLKTGVVKIEFTGGAFVVLHSPSAFQVTSSSSARLLSGEVSGRAEDGNFVLSTPTATVVDIGTEFGVGVLDDGITDVTVFDGEVHVYPSGQSQDDSQSLRLVKGMSVRMESTGNSHSPRTTNLPDFSSGVSDYYVEGNSSNEPTISLLELLGGESHEFHLAGSIDPVTGFWGKPPWHQNEDPKDRRGDTQYSRAFWNSFIDGVFVPRSNAREMQITSDGHVVFLPPNSGSTWGPVWARRNYDIARNSALVQVFRNGRWGENSLEAVFDRLADTRVGLMGMHANAGITFDLEAVREKFSCELVSLKAAVSNLVTNSPEGEGSVHGLSDYRVFLDGRLQYSRIAFSQADGEELTRVPIRETDRFLTIVVTESVDGNLSDRIVLIDPELEVY